MEGTRSGPRAEGASEGLRACGLLGLHLLVPQVGGRQPCQKASRPSTGGALGSSGQDTSWAWKWQAQESIFVKNNY